MPSFSYKAMDEFGKTVRSRMTAENSIDLEARLKEVSLDLINYKELHESKMVNIIKPGGVKIKDKIMLCVQFEQLDKAGVPILEALADLRDSTDNLNLKRVLAEVYEEVRNGAMLSEAMLKYPKIFDSVFTGLIAAGENTGNMHDSFVNLINHLKWSGDIKRKIKKAVMYPIFTLILMGGVIAFMMNGVVPQLETFLKAQGQEMPGYTKALIATSDFFADYWWLILFLPIFLVLFVKVMKVTSVGFRYRWDAIMLRFPLIGKPKQKIDLARFTRFFSILYTSGIDILDCLKIAQETVNNKVIVDSIIKVRKLVTEGSSLTAALRSTNQFPSLVLRMFKIGEDSGNMKEALENVNYFYDQEVNDAVESMVSSIKPVLTLVLGGILAWIAISMFGPLYATIEKMQM